MSSRIARAFPFRAFHLALIATLLLEPMSASARSSSTKSTSRTHNSTTPAKRNTASTPSLPKKLGLPHRALMRLPALARRELIRAYIEALIRYERAHPTRLASQKNPEGISLAELLDLASDSVFPLAFAGERCISAGWAGELQTVGGRSVCKLPPQADEYRKSCSSGQEPCNPGLLGGYGSGRAICINRSGSQNFTDRCEAKMRSERGSGALKMEPWEYEYEYDSVAKNIDSVTRDRDRYLQKDVARIMSENKERLAGFTEHEKKDKKGSDTSNQWKIIPGGSGGGSSADDASMDLAETDDAHTPTPPGSGSAGQNSAAQNEGTFTLNNDLSIKHSGLQDEKKVPGDAPSGAPGSDPQFEHSEEYKRAKAVGTQLEDGSILMNDGTRVDAQGNVVSQGRGVRERERYDYEKYTDESDDCKVGAAIDGKYSCGTTRAVVEGGRVANAVAQGVGSASQQVMGMQSQMDLMKKGGNQGDALREGAKLQDTAANMQLGLGAMNAALGAWELWKAHDHKKNQKEIESGYKDHGLTANTPDVDPSEDLAAYKNYDLSGDGKSLSGPRRSKPNQPDMAEATTTEGLATQGKQGQHGYLSSQKEFGGKIVENFHINDVKSLRAVKTTDADVEAARKRMEAAATPQEREFRKLEYEKVLNTRKQEIAARNQDLDEKQDLAERNIKTIGRKAASEQTGIANEATGAGVQSIVAGAQQLITGFFNKKSAAMMKDAANSFQAPSGSGFKPIQPIINPGDPLAPRSPTVIGGSTATPENAEASDEEIASDGNTLGDPPNIGENPSDLQNQAPTAGRFIAGDPDKGGGGGGGGSLGGGGTSPSQGGGDEPGARMADNRESAAYAGGGGGGGYGGGGRGAGGGEKGPDLSGLLAQFLPKGDDDKGGKNGILDFGGREPQGPEDSGAFFDKTTNLFERIHDTYQEKQRKRNVGI